MMPVKICEITQISKYQHAWLYIYIYIYFNSCILVPEDGLKHLVFIDDIIKKFVVFDGTLCANIKNFSLV